MADSFQSPRKIKVDASDNVAIVVNEGGLAAGSIFDDGLSLVEDVPQGHKVALRVIKDGEAIIRYGQPIGYATRELAAGAWVEESSVRLPPAPDLDALEALLASDRSASADAEYLRLLDEDLSRLGIEEFLGYPNPDGSAGTKNMLGLIASVQCVAGVLLKVVERIEQELLPRYPNVDGVTAINHAYGCGVALDAAGGEIPVRTLANLAVHPNLGGLALVVGLGCEKLQPDMIAPDRSPSQIVVLQNEAGFSGMAAALMREAEARLKVLDGRKRKTRPLADLVVGLQCGGSDAFSGVTANPAIGYAADLLVRAGATVMFSEVTEVRDGIDRLVARAADAAVARRLIEEMRWYDEYLERGGMDRSANPTPGNKKGGLANIVEKALGSIAKSGLSPISGVLGPGERRPVRGLVFAATPASDFVCGTEQLASGIHLQVFSTGRGTPYGLAMAPVVKVASRSAIAQAWPDLFDVDAGRIAEGLAGIEDVGREIFRMIVDVASGRSKPWADRHGIRNDLTIFNPSPIT